MSFVSSALIFGSNLNVNDYFLVTSQISQTRLETVMTAKPIWIKNKTRTHIVIWVILFWFGRCGFVLIQMIKLPFLMGRVELTPSFNLSIKTPIYLINFIYCQRITILKQQVLVEVHIKWRLDKEISSHTAVIQYHS